MRKLSMVVALGTIFSLALAVPALALGPVTNLGDGNNTYSELQRGICPTATAPNGDQEVNGRGGNDTLLLNQCGDTAGEPNAADSDDDTGRGNRGIDVVRVDDGDIQDDAIGGGGTRDTCRGDLDLGTTLNVDDPPTGPGGGTGMEDVGDILDASCENKEIVRGEFYAQT
jgi:hypothetical protein